MAVIDTDEKFALACNWLVDNGQLQVTGERQVIPSERKVYDAVPNPNPPPGQLLTDITPSQAILEAALDSALAAIADAEELAEAIAHLEEGFVFLRQQLDDDTPASLTTMTNNIKNRVDNNAYLTRWMTRYLNVWSGATTLPVSMNPNTDPLRNRYVLVFSHLVSIRRQVV